MPSSVPVAMIRSMSSIEAKRTTIVIDNTHGPKAEEGHSIATDIFQALGKYLAPNDPIVPPT